MQRIFINNVLLFFALLARMVEQNGTFQRQKVTVSWQECWTSGLKPKC